MTCRNHHAVILLPGLWLPAPGMCLLQRRLHRLGYKVYRFDYSAVFSKLETTTRQLQVLVDGIEEQTLHFIGYSLGGLLLYHFFCGQRRDRAGAVILLGSPISGSQIARRTAKLSMGRMLLGHSLQYGLLGDLPTWPRTQPMVMIAGTRGVGIGQSLLRGLARPNDGTVAVIETRSPDVSKHITLAVSHTGLLFSRQVSDRIALELEKAGCPQQPGIY